MTNIAKALGLAPEATEDAIIAEIKKNFVDHARVVNERAEARLALAKLQASAELTAPHVRKAAAQAPAAQVSAPAAAQAPAAQ
jgi:hypothetical protein